MNSYQQALRAIAQGNDEQAVSMLGAMTERYPSFSGPHANLGLIYLRQGDHARAEAALQAYQEREGLIDTESRQQIVTAVARDLLARIPDGSTTRP